MRVTVLARMTEGVQAALLARARRQREAIRATAMRSAERVFARVQDLCPRDTGYMADHTRVEITRRGFNFAIGWRAEDFVGHTNPVNGRLITAFYPFFVVHGTRFMAGRDPLRPAMAAERENIRRGFRRALGE